ncbi:DUF4932 domain-containing protein [Dyadobacter helix]|nr:DUF4932 domain-containing protein [Dyadobacter sp. CECT 9275]
MLRSTFFLLALLWASHSFGITFKSAEMHCQGSKISVQVNNNVELLGFVYFLGYEGRESVTNPQYSEKNKKRYAYGLDLYHRYKRFENSKHLAVAMGFAENIWLDYFINLLLQLDDFPNARLRDSIDTRYYARFSNSGNLTEARNNAIRFIDAMNAIYVEVDFGTYLRQSQPFYRNAMAQVLTGIPDSNFIPQMEAFYQGSFESYALYPSLTIPTGMGFGVCYQKDVQTHAAHVFGAFAPPAFSDTARLDMGFRDPKHLLELSTHEFGHSFVNPAVDQIPEALIKVTENYFIPIREAMSDQGYTGWKSCLYEHFVRAGEVIIARNLGDTEKAERLKDYYTTGRKFIYLPILLTELEKYNANRTIPYSTAVRLAMEGMVNDATKR